MQQDSSNPLIRVESLDDPRIADYRDLKDRDLAARGDRFIAEGELVTRRLLASPFAVESLLLAEHQAAAIAPLARPGVPVYVAPAAVVSRIVGFRFHSGVMAIGLRRATPSLDEAAGRWGPQATVVVLPETSNTENLGAMLRISAGFGADAVVLGPRTCDPFYRQSLRVSMGAALSLTLVRSADLADDLARMRGRWGVQLVGAVLDESAEPLAAAARAPRTALLFGNEAAGLRPEVLAMCDRRVTIPMRLGTDSLNVAVAAGVFLHHFTQAAGPAPRL
ncbi:MAG: 23S rRNA (guanosine-2'-O-)-methyltransferase RlmB [Phycisphaerae bacterium]|nr:23S rRNA (guanosine-2'-O-)-methyltransferase RlmB [Phycisphaerae bacterium]